MVGVRHQVLRLAAGLPAGRGVADGSDLSEPVAWRCPLLAGQHPDFDRLVAATWLEAQQLGVVARGALSPLGRALVGSASEPDPAATPGGPAGPATTSGQVPVPTATAGELAPPDPQDVAAACRKLLPPAAGEAVFQADLTALVPGTPARPLAVLLDAAADRESRGGAVTWRFTPQSVRRALDAGYRPADLLAQLRARSAAQTLPQPLEYLVTDLARRHGAVRVRQVACVLRADDPALLAELAGARALRPLQLSVLAPTVLGSARPVAETLAALRAAGYAPVGESDDGVPQVERATPRRAGGTRPRARSGGGGAGGGRSSGGLPGRAHRAGQGAPAGEDPLALATRLLAAPVPAQRARPRPAGARPGPQPYPLPYQPGDEPELELDPPDLDPPDLDPPELVELLAELAGHLDPGERRLLAHAIETAHPVTIGYTNAQGNRTVRVIDSVELDGTHLIAWCHLRSDERMFSLHRIDTVAPAG